jgi:hypothetical protein
MCRRFGTGAISVISMRGASRKERSRYDKLPRHMRHISDEEEAETQRKIASDPDAPEATDEELAQAKPFAEVFPDPAESIKRPEAGRPSRTRKNKFLFVSTRISLSTTRQPEKAGRAE